MLAEKLPESVVDDTGQLVINPMLSKAFLPVISCTARYLLMMGSAGSGKSQTACRKMLLRCINEGDHKFLVLRKVGATIRNSVWAITLEILQAWGVPHTKNKTDFTVHLPLSNSTILFCGLDDPEKIKSIQGVTSIWMEEATEFSEPDFSELDRRLRGDMPHYKQIMMSFNPDEATIGGAWLKADFFDVEHDDSYLHHSTVYDNTQLNDPKYIQILERTKDPIQRKIYLLGQWAAAKGLIFTDVKIVDEIPEELHKIYGIDFGYNDPAVLLEIGLAGTKLYIKELLYKSEILTSDIIKALDDNKVDKMASIFCDAAEPDRIDQIFKAGYRCVKPAKKDVQAGIDYVKTFTILTLGDNDQSNRDFKRYKWKEDKNGVLLDEPAHMFSNAPDALRYAVYTYFLEQGLLDDNDDFDLR